MAIVGDSVQLSAQGMNLAIREGRLNDALAMGQHCAQAHPNDPLAILVFGRAEQANKQRDKAAAAYHKAFQMVKDSPERQMHLVNCLLATTDPSDAADGEQALRDLLPRYPPAALQLVTFLTGRQRFDEALAVANSGVRTYPKEAIAHLALGSALQARRTMRRQRPSIRRPSVWRPMPLARPASCWISIWPRARETRSRHVRQDDCEGQTARSRPGVACADTLVRIGERKEAVAAYRKAVEIAKDDPPVTMRLAEFLLDNRDAEDEAEGERLLRQIAPRHEPHRRLARLLIGRGDEADWEEGLKFLQQSDGDPAFDMDLVTEVRLLMRRAAPPTW